MARLRSRPALLAYAALLFFWGLSLARLDRFPLVNADEPWALSPGYTLFTRGVFGSPLFTGFFGSDLHYLSFPPLMSLAQGAAARLLGLGVFQMRFLPVVYGLLILALAYRLGRRLGQPATGLLAVVLLLFWQWTPGADGALYSGVPLVDLSRVARYDILAALLVLAAFVLALENEAPRSWQAGVVGLLAGLAALAHYYELLWVLLLPGLFLVGAALRHRLRLVWRAAVWMLAAGLLPAAAWLAFVLAYRSDYVGQAWGDRQRLDWLNPSFYLNNVLTETHRYMLGARDPATVLRVGLWLLAAGVPLTWLWLARRWWRGPRDWRVLWLLAACAAYPLALALFVWQKRFNYLLTVIPLLAVLLALGLQPLYRARRGWAMALLALVVGQGALGLVRMQQRAGRVVQPAAFFAQLRQTLPAPARILGPLEYWLAFPDNDYRALELPALLCLPDFSPVPLDCPQAMASVAPDAVLLDASGQIGLGSDGPLPNNPQSAAFWAYLHQRDGRLVAILPDDQGQTVLVYQLDPRR